MLFSIITIVHNNIKDIEACIKSVLNQSFKDIEFIIIDGGSVDGTLNIIKKYESKIKSELKNFVLISEPDDGIYDALNKGIKQSSGEVIGFLHSDDIYPNNDVLNNVASAFEKNKTDSLYGDLEYVDKVNTYKIIRKWKSGEFSDKKIKSGWMPPHPALFIKKEIYEKYGLYNTLYKISSDYDMILRLLFKNKISTFYVPEVLVKMRVGGQSNKSIPNIIQKSMEDYSALKSNQIKFPLKALLYKNISKLPQFFLK